MSHQHQGPEYFTLSRYDTCNGDYTQLGIFENLAAVAARLQVIYASCGDEFRIECFHLQTQTQCENDLVDTLHTRNEYRIKNEKKDELYAEYEAKRSEEKAIQEDIKLDKRHADLDALDDEWAYQR